jgi:hypothetical protein
VANSQQIEERIDRERAGAIALNPASRNMLTIAPASMADLFEFAKMMAISGQCIPPVFRDKPGACLALALQAFRTGADPFAVANKAYLVNDRIAYEAQFITAVINTSGILKRRLRATYEGEGQALRCTISGEVQGEDEPLQYRSPTIGSIPVKNSPLWKSDPEQQLFYYSARAWARRHAPEVILGMDTGEDIESRAIDVTPPPKPQRDDFVDIANPLIQKYQNSQNTAGRTADPEPWFLVINEDGEEQEFEHAADAVERVIAALNDAARRTDAHAHAVFENNDRLLLDLELRGNNQLAAQVQAHYQALMKEQPSSNQPEAAPKRRRATKAEMEVRRAAAAENLADAIEVYADHAPNRQANQDPESELAPPSPMGDVEQRLSSASTQGLRELYQFYLYELTPEEQAIAKPLLPKYEQMARAENKASAE